ncbi:WD REPEATS REGION domain-containing protein [Citrus sinensis]|uniref:WD REPEATS REGION domain-containing protein n=1 Tax=Citrus sinensis TaxID=2711 RepID=A0ACB8KYI6_CITSI|nr:WD REPEATS REGION domain-containing protein [Citrus sinensis]
MQGGSSGIGYGLKYQARCISDVKADTDHTSFLTGTLSLKEENEVHLLRLSSGGTELICEGESYGAAIWQIPELYGQLNSPQLERIAALDAHVGKINCIDEENIFLWSLDCSNKNAQVQSKQSSGMLHYLSGGAWDPHDVNAVAATCESSVQFWDLRSMGKTNSIEHAHVRNVDYDTKKKHLLVTAADESGIHLWDLRMLKAPIQELPGHTHWTWAVCCNPEYDGFILSAGTDSTVNLWLVSTSNHDELPSESLVESPNQRANSLLNSYSDYEDSVYGLAWSSREPWIFASLSYDGRVVVESLMSFPFQNLKQGNVPQLLFVRTHVGFPRLTADNLVLGLFIDRSDTWHLDPQEFSATYLVTRKLHEFSLSARRRLWPKDVAMSSISRMRTRGDSGETKLDERGSTSWIRCGDFAFQQD